VCTSKRACLHDGAGDSAYQAVGPQVALAIFMGNCEKGFVGEVGIHFLVLLSSAFTTVP
jgi:hypothetical protein